MTERTFVYTDNMQKGLFAYYWGVIHALSKLEDGDKLYVDLSKKTPYYDPNYMDTDNVWEYYFEQPFLDYNFDNAILSDFQYFCPIPDNFQFGLDGTGNYSLSYTSEGSKGRIELAKELTKRYLKIKPHVLQKINQFEDQYMKGHNILGVQYRGGEAFHTAHGRNQFHLMNIEYHISKIDENLKTDKYDKIFLITNDQHARDTLMNHYGDLMIKYDCELLCPPGVHLDIPWLHNDRNYEKGEFAVIDCILLSKCAKILATSSNLTLLSVILNEGETEFIDSHVKYS